MRPDRYAKYAIDQPKLVTEIAHRSSTEVSGFTFPDEVYLDG